MAPSNSAGRTEELRGGGGGGPGNQTEEMGARNFTDTCLSVPVV